MNKIIIKGAREHNLKNIDVEIPRSSLVVITGLSGSGKSSLALDTIYAEGQRRYVESLSAYARQFLEQMDKPDVDSIEGLSPAISIEQKSSGKNPRSTVGTVTEIYDYLRLLFARIGIPHCYQCGKAIVSQTIQQITDQILRFPHGARINILSPIVRGKRGEYQKELKNLRKNGYVRVKIDGEIKDLSEEISLDKNKKHDIDVMVDRLTVKAGLEGRLADSLEIASNLSDGLIKAEVIGKEELLFSEKLACPDCGVSYPELSPRMFSFNSPYGACTACGGMGTRIYFDPDLIIPDRNLSLREGAVLPWRKRESVYFYQILDALAQHYHFNIYTPFRDLPSQIQKVILYGSGEEKIKFYFEENEQRHSYRNKFEGIINILNRRYQEAPYNNTRKDIERYMNNRPCDVCKGSRLKKESLAVKVQGMSINQITVLTVTECLHFFQGLKLDDRTAKIAERIIKEVTERLMFLENVGLGYLTLDRTATTLSGGEGQRIRLASQVGTSLTGVLYVLDEPSIGLHQRDNLRLLNTLNKLKDLGNTVVVIEHDAQTILSADYIIDMGPGAGEGGGEIIFSGPPEKIINDEKSLTGKYLSGKLTIPVPEKRRKTGTKHISIKGASENNLKHIDIDIPLGVFTAVTGVSGSGKSSLIIDTLYRILAQRLYYSRERAGRVENIEGLKFIDRVINIDQDPIGRTPRSNPATYTGVFTYIRELFTKTKESKVRGYRPGRYSFNVKGGRCEACAGDGIIKIEMQFLPDVYVVCDVCKGKRYNRETLEIRYKGMNVADILDMTVDQALIFLEKIPHIKSKLQTLSEVGLGYIRLGQSATTLSGGEAQRIKLAKELSKKSAVNTLYILDEPTTGLHFADIHKLLTVLNKLIDIGNSVIVIEHNLDVIKTADHIIDLGPEGGDKGGEIVAMGTPEEISQNNNSFTGQFLKPVLTP